MLKLNRNSSQRAIGRRGATLIDVAVGSMLLTVLLIPAIHMIGKSQSSQRRLVNREIMVYQADQMLENVKVQLADPTAFDAAMLTPIDTTRLISIPDGPDLNSRLRVAADTSIAGARLVTIVADVWYDENVNAVFDSVEQGESLQTQWGSP